MSESTPEIQEEPSMVKERFKRWIIVSSVLISLLFVYILFGMTAKEKEKDMALEEDIIVPQQVQDAESKNVAIEAFQKSIKPRERNPIPEKMEDVPIHKDFAPRKFIAQKQYQKTQQLQENPQTANTEQTMYQKFQEEEQLRALRSIRAVSTIGDDSAFYEDKQEIKSSKEPDNQVTPAPTLSFSEKQALAQRQRESVSHYIQALKKGEIDPSAVPPTALLQPLELHP